MSTRATVTIYDQSESTTQEWSTLQRNIRTCCSHFDECSSYLDKGHVRQGVRTANIFVIATRNEVNSMTGRVHQSLVGFACVALDLRQRRLTIMIIFAVKAGSQMMEEIRELARRASCTHILLDATPAALGFYTRLGYEFYNHERGLRKFTVQQTATVQRLRAENKMAALAELGVYNTVDETFYMMMRVD
jgi:hypothetical protein